MLFLASRFFRHKQPKDHKMKVAVLLDLPDDLLIHILSFLKVLDLLHFGSASKKVLIMENNDSSAKFWSIIMNYGRSC